MLCIIYMCNIFIFYEKLYGQFPSRVFHATLVHFPSNSITRRIQNKSRPLLPVYIIHNFIVCQFRVESSRRSGRIYIHIHSYGRRHIIRLLVSTPKLFRFVTTRNPWSYFISVQVLVMNLVAAIFFSLFCFSNIFPSSSN